MSKAPSCTSGPAAMGALNPAQVIGDLAFQHGVDGLAEVVAKQHIFRRDGAVGFQFEHPVSVRLPVSRATPCVAEAMLASSAPPVSGPTDCCRNACRSTSAIACPVSPEPTYSCPTGSGLPHGKDEIGGAVARPHRSLDGGRQPRISPVAGKKQVFVSRDRRPAAARFVPAWPRRWRGARARSATAAVRPRRRAALQMSRQIACASSSRGISTSRSALLMVTDSRCGNANSHSTSPPTTPRIGRLSLRRIEAEMRIDDGAEFGRRFQARQQRCGGARRNRHHHGIAGLMATLSSPNFNSPTRFADIANSRSSCPNWMLAPLSCSSLIAGSTSTALRPSRAISGRQACASRQQRFPHDRAGKPRGALGRIDVQRRQQQRLHQPLVERALAGDRVADQFALRCPDQRHQREIIAAGRCRGHGAPRRRSTAAAGSRRGRAASAARS